MNINLTTLFGCKLQLSVCHLEDNGEFNILGLNFIREVVKK